MMRAAAGYITGWLIRHSAITEEDRSLYEYAICSLILTISPLIIVITGGCIMALVKESILFILPFMVIRKYSGGLHLKHAWACLLSSCIVLCLCIYVTARIPCNGIVSLLMLAAVISLGIFSPVDSENRQLDSQEKKKYKKITIWIAMAFFSIYVLLLLLRLDYYAKWIAAGLILPAISQIPVALKRISGKYRERN